MTNEGRASLGCPFPLWNSPTICRKLSGKSKITKSDELAILAAVPPKAPNAC
jgi:hypothetical protein